MTQQASAPTLVKYVQGVAELLGSSRPGLAFHCTEDVVARHGKAYMPQPLPSEYKYGQMGECYRNAYLLTLLRNNLIYVEGFALISLELPVPIQHAWAVDLAGYVIDVTWREPGAEYYGVPISSGYLTKTIYKTRNYGLFFHNNRDLWERGFEPGDIYEG